VVVPWTLLVTPQNDRVWSADQTVSPSIEMVGETAMIRGLRDCDYRSTEDFTVQYRDDAYTLDSVNSVWFVVEPFSPNSPIAHTFLSFGFDDGRYLAVSVEIRKEVGESYSPLAGIFRRYELMYVIGDEADLIELRAVHRRDDVFLYPVRATRTQARDLFADVLRRAEDLRQHPEFYHSLTNTCTTNIVDHVERMRDVGIGFRLAIVFPGYADQLAYDLGLLATDLPFADCRRRYRIDPAAAAIADRNEFSRRIRQP